MTGREIIDKWLNETKSALIANYDRLGLRASGKWASSLEEFVEDSGGSFSIGMLGEKYTGAIETGRRPNKNSSVEELQKWAAWAGSTIIKKWVEDKGLSGKLNPFAVAYSIGRDGWKVPSPNNAGGLVSDVVTKQRINDLNKSLALFYIGEFKSDVIKTLR